MSQTYTAEQLLESQRIVLEQIAKGVNMADVLNTLCMEVENLLGGGACSTVLLLKENQLYHGAAPSISSEYSGAIDGLQIGPAVGSCGTAAYLQKLVIVSDIATDPLWKNHKAIAAKFNLAACWSTPIFSSEEKVLGTFATYYPIIKSPLESDLALISRFGYLAGLAIERSLTEEAIRDREENLEITLNSIADAVIATDMDGCITRFNPAAEKLTGWSGVEAQGLPLQAVMKVMDQSGRRLLQPTIAVLIESGVFSTDITPVCLKSNDGKKRYIESSVAPIKNKKGQTTGAIIALHDVTAQFELQEKIHAGNARLRSFSQVIPDIAFVLSRDGLYVEIYGSDEALLYANAEELIGKNISDVLPEESAQFILDVIKKTLDTEEVQNVEYSLNVIGGQKVFEGRTAVMKAKDNLKDDQVVWMARDITEKKKTENEIQQLAYYDPLTQLPNRRLLADRLRQEINAAKRHKMYTSVIFLDLDNFKILNDSLGHSTGDLLLELVARRIFEQVRCEDTVSRLGGDEFVILLTELTAKEEDAVSHAQVVARKIQRCLIPPFLLGDQEYHITASFGVSILSSESQDPDEILKQSDSAMYQAKSAGRNAIYFYRPNMQTAVDARLKIERELRHAIEQQQLVPYYQPQVNAQGGCVGAEALVRWPHPKQGLISPAAFIPVAESTGLIMRLGNLVLEKTCEDMGCIARNCRKNEFQFSVNVSPRQFVQDDYVKQVSEAMLVTRIEPRWLKLEITEGMVVEGITNTVKKMHALKELGVHFSIDDFGTGYSSLSYLSKMPLDELKIDQSFVANIATSRNDCTIIKTILSMSKHLGFKVVAEGVETEQQFEFLINNGCRFFQGYYFGKPMGISDFQEWCRNNDT